MSNALEVLEDRIAPAGLATFVDVDGDVVTVKSSVGTSLALQAAVTAAVGGDNLTPSQMQTLTLGSPFAGGAIKISVTGKASGGDGMVNVWAIDATGIDLASVEVRGDLASLTVGDAIAANGSVKTVSVQSIGVSGGAMDKGWLMAGGTGLFTVAGDVNGARLFWYNSADAGSIAVGKIFIGGALKGGAGVETGLIEIRPGSPTADLKGTATLTELFVGRSLESTAFSQTASVIVGNVQAPSDLPGVIGKVTVGGSLLGAAGKESTALIFASTSIGAVNIGGKLTGGGDGSGSIYAATGSIGPVNIGQSVFGGDGGYSGSIFAHQSIGAVTIGGALFGGTGDNSGSIRSYTAGLGPVKLGAGMFGGDGDSSGSILANTSIGLVQVSGNLVGGTGTGSGSVTAANGNFAGVTVDGSVVGGDGNGSGYLGAQGAVGAVKISGSLIGGAGSTSGYLVGSTLLSLSIGKNFEGGSGYASGYVAVQSPLAKTSFISIGGSMIGTEGVTSANFSGSIRHQGSVTKLTIGGDVRGGDSANSGWFRSFSLGSFAIGGDVVGGSGTSAFASGSVNMETLGTGVIGGNVVGGDGSISGSLFFSTGKSLVIRGGIAGGAGNHSGYIDWADLGTLRIGTAGLATSSLSGGGGAQSGYLTGGRVVSAFIAGDIAGGSTEGAGSFYLGIVGNLTIGGSVLGGSAINTGSMVLTTVTGKLTIGGNLEGTSDQSGTGNVFAISSIAALEIKGSILGGNASKSGIINSGSVVVQNALTSIIVGGDIVGGSGFNASTFNLGSVRAGNIGSLWVKGDVTGTASQSVLLSGTGTASVAAIGTVRIDGSVTFADIIGGYLTETSTINGDGGFNAAAKLGTITISGNFVDSSIVTGVQTNTTNPNAWANGTNTLLGSDSLIASITKIVIRGATSASVQNGIAAERILSLTLGDSLIPIAPGAQHFKAGPTDFWVQQVS